MERVQPLFRCRPKSRVGILSVILSSYPFFMSKLFNPDYLLSLCKKYGLTPSKQYGQNYLLDSEVIAAMIDAAKICPDDLVVEVGPGFGVLTLPLVDVAKEVVSYEIEKKLAPYWEKLQKDRPNLTVNWGNALKTFVPPTKPYKVAANLPYQITSAVIRLFLEASLTPQVIVCMVQKEVAERICAKPGDMSLLAISVQYFGTPTLVRVVPRSSFWPSPAVDSAIISVKPHAVDRTNEKWFFDVVKAGFAQRRKFLIKNLLPLVGKKNKPEVELLFQKIGLTPEARAQELSMDQWQELVKGLSTYAQS